MAPHVFAYRRGPGIPYRILVRGLPPFGHGKSDQRYRLIDDDEVATQLLDHSRRQDVRLFRHLSPEDLEAALGSAADAAEAIEAGEHDDVLDLLLFAERNEFGTRVTVIDAIADRKTKLEQQYQAGTAETDVLTPGDVAPLSELAE
jgi:hypothetical protein